MGNVAEMMRRHVPTLQPHRAEVYWFAPTTCPRRCGLVMNINNTILWMTATPSLHHLVHSHFRLKTCLCDSRAVNLSFADPFQALQAEDFRMGAKTFQEKVSPLLDSFINILKGVAKVA